MNLGAVGIWWSGLWPNDRSERGDLLGQLYEAGYRTVWRSGGFERGLSPDFASMLAAHDQMNIASGIHSIWAGPARETAAGIAELDTRYPGRFLFGIGASHAVLVDSTGQRYEHPYSRTVTYLDELDGGPHPIPSHRRVLAALGPRMLALARDRALGAHPYFVPLEHTQQARSILGVDPVLAPELAVVLEDDPSQARQMARSYMELYLGLPNYTQNLRRLGYDDDDLTNGGSDRLVDAIVAHGDETTVAASVRAHLEAGANHVCVQVLNGGYQHFPLTEYLRLARALLPL